MKLRWSPIFTTKENEIEIEKMKSNHFPGNEEKVEHSSEEKPNGNQNQ